MMEQVITQWLTAHGASAAVVMIVLALYVQLVPALLQLLRAQAKQVKKAELRQALMALVRAAEQIFGGETTPENNAKKLQFVRDGAPGATLEQIESVVHEVKAPLKAIAQAAAAGGLIEAAKQL